MRKNARRRFVLDLPEAVADRITEIADKRGMKYNELMRLALGYLDMADRASERGDYIGTTRVREYLDQVMVTPL